MIQSFLVYFVSFSRHKMLLKSVSLWADCSTQPIKLLYEVVRVIQMISQGLSGLSSQAVTRYIYI